MIVTLSGMNSYMRSKALGEIINPYIKEYGDIGLDRVQCAERTYGQLVDSIQAMPFLVSKSMVILDTPSGNKELNEKIKAFLELVNDQIDVVFVEPKFDKRSILYKTLKKLTDFREFNELDEHGLTRWITQYVKEERGSITPTDARYLVHRIGIDQLRLRNELQKLLSYDAQITKDSIDLLTEQTPTSTTFDLLDAALRGDHRRALQLYEQQRKQKIEPQAILALLAWQLNVLAIIKAGGPRSAGEIAKDAKLNPYVVQKSYALASNLTVSKIKESIARTLDLDIRLKSQSIDADEALQDLLMTLH